MGPPVFSKGGFQGTVRLQPGTHYGVHMGVADSGILLVRLRVATEPVGKAAGLSVDDDPELEGVKRIHESVGVDPAESARRIELMRSAKRKR